MLIAAAMGGDRLDLTGFEDRCVLQGDEEEELLFSDLHVQREIDARDESEGLKGGNSTKVRSDTQAATRRGAALALVELSLLPKGQH